MKKWRPVKSIQTKVIGLCINKGRLLAMEVYGDSGEVKGVRPLGGVIEFGETRETALGREYLEELGTTIKMIGGWRTFENLFIHEGVRGHEYVFAIGVQLADRSLYSREVIVFSEDSGDASTARWFEVDALREGKIELYPTGLRSVI
ncbi:MAG: NUDIX domain-containing protein [Granulosicoccus sp.]|nr:NUDIX domain-containing protein [Granulosicoccus sp.]